MKKDTVIQYIDLNPGLGKTYWAIHQIDNFLKDSFSEGLMLYVAPTLSLLKEVYTSLIDLGYTKEDIKLITSENRKNVIADFPRILKGYTSYVTALSKFSSDDLDTDSAEFFIECSKQAAKDDSIILVKEKDVLLITHEVFWRSNFNNPKYPIPNRDKMTVILDETRECFLDSLSIKAKGVDLLNRCKSYFGITDEKVFSEVSLNKLNPDNLILALPEIFQSVTTRKLQQLNTIVSRSGASAFVKADMRKSDTGELYIVLNFVQIPFNAVTGWRSITIIASFYTKSQLYHIIESSERFAGTGDVPKFQQVNISSEVNCKDRIDQIQNRYKVTDIAYVFDRPISITGYSSGILFRLLQQLSSTVLNEKLERFFSIYADELGIRKSKAKNQFKTILESFNLLTKTKVLYNKDTQLTEVEDDFSALSVMNPELGDLSKELCIAQNPFDYGCYTALNIAEKWIKDYPSVDNRTSKDLNIAMRHPFLLCVNQKNFINPYSEKSLYEEIPETVSGKCDRLTGDSRGLNTYKNYNVVLFLASVRPDPAMVEWFKCYCPEYDATVDRTLGYCIQTVMRCSLRNVDSKEHVLLVLPDKMLAEQVKQSFNDLPTIRNPEEFGQDHVMIVTENWFYDEPSASKGKSKKKASKIESYVLRQKRREYMSVYNKGEYVTGLKAFTAKYVKEHYTGIPKSTLYRSRALLQNEVAQLQQQKSKCDPKSSVYDTLCKVLSEKENELFTLEADADAYRSAVKEATAKYRALWDKKKNIVPKEEAVIRSFVISGKKRPNPTLSRKELFSQYINTVFPKPIMTKKYNLGYRKVQLEKRLDILKTVLQSKEIESLGIAKATLSELFGIRSLLICNLDAITKALRRFDSEYKEAKKQFDLATAKGMDSVQALIEQASPVSLDYFPRVKFIRKTTEANIALSALFNLVLPSIQERNEAIELFSAE